MFYYNIYYYTCTYVYYTYITCCVLFIIDINSYLLLIINYNRYEFFSENNVNERTISRLRCLDLREFGFISANRQVAQRKLSYTNIGASNPQIIDPARQFVDP